MSFFNLYRHNFIRVAVAVPTVAIGDPASNARQTIDLLREATARKVVLAAFPELGLTGYSCEDLFHQDELLSSAAQALKTVVDASNQFETVAVVGLPVRVDSLLYNCGAVVHRGRILGIVPKTYLPNYREFYELRQFAPGDACRRKAVGLLDQRDIPFGARLLFQLEQQPLFTSDTNTPRAPGAPGVPGCAVPRPDRRVFLEGAVCEVRTARIVARRNREVPLGLIDLSSRSDLP